MKARLLIFVITTCMIVTPAMADLFHFTVHKLDMTYNGTTFTGDLASTGDVDFSRAVAPTGDISFVGGATGDFNISMIISNIVGLTADGAGSWTLIDTIGDTITGNVAGDWSMVGSTPIFVGTVSNVLWNNESADNDFDGDSASVSMVFGASQPWLGSLVELTASNAPWFGGGAWLNADNTLKVITGGSVDANVVPVPTAVVLGVLGLGVVGWKLRKYA